MHKLNRLAFANVWQFCSDFAFLVLSFIAAYLLAHQFIYLSLIYDYLWVMAVYIPFWMIPMGLMGMYNKTTFNYIDRILRNVMLATLISGISVAVIFYLTRNSFFSRRLYAFLLIFTIILLLFERFAFLYFFRKYRSSVDRKAIIIGSQDIIDKFEHYVNKTQISINITGYVSVDRGTTLAHGTLGCMEDLEDILKDNIVDEVIFALPGKYTEIAEKYVCLCEEMGLTVRFVLDMYELKLAKTCLTCVGTLPMITFHTVSLNNVQIVIKRTIDITGALIGLLLTGLASIFVIPAIKLDSPGPVFFKQDRVGMNGRIFKLYKYRSMHVDAEEQKKKLMAKNQVKGGLMFKVEDDPRITRAGKILRKLSIDELPQFWNILKGDMSLVGTRPPTTDEVSRYNNSHWRRISIKPGLTGLWQVSGRSSILDFDEVVKLDTCYIDKWSVIEDFKIIFKTIPAVFAKRGAM